MTISNRYENGKYLLSEGAPWPITVETSAQQWLIVSGRSEGCRRMTSQSVADFIRDLFSNYPVRHNSLQFYYLQFLAYS